MGIPLPKDEEQRLAALLRLDILDTPAEERFDRIVRVGRRLFEAPLAGISLIDKDRQWLKACFGFERGEITRDTSFCAHVILDDAPMVVADTLEDDRFKDNPAVTSDSGLRWYAGYPLRSPDGFRIGAFWVADTQPRPGAEVDLEALRDLAGMVEQQFAAKEIHELAQSLQASEALFRQMAEAIAEVFWVTNPAKSEMLYVSPAYAEVWGRSPQSLYAEPRSFVDAIHEEDRPQVLAAMQEQAEGGYDMTYRVVRPDGSVRCVRDRAFPIYDEHGAVARIAGVAIDISEIRDMQEELEYLNYELESVINNVPGMIYRCHSDGHWTMDMVSDYALQLTGYPASDFIDNAVRSFGSIIHSEDRERVESVVQAAVADNRPFTIEYRIIQKNGQERWVYEYGQVMRDSKDKNISLHGTILDISQRKVIEARQTAMQETIIQMQQAALAELSTPLIPITRGVVVMPLIGALDTHRAQQVLETLLDGAARNQARMAIIDITGVAVVDTHVAGVLVRAAQAVRLLGTQVAISGIRPEVAQTLVSLGTDLREMQTFSSLQNAIETVLHLQQRRAS